ncbi:MAG: hypothetical protein VX423_05060 [Pseudomonadota bacterium]|nr:hypothetical protein [Pseudomonadota bacterium]
MYDRIRQKSGRYFFFADTTEAVFFVSAFFSLLFLWPDTTEAQRLLPD